MKRKVGIVISLFLLTGMCWLGTRFFLKYQKDETMQIRVEEVSTADYPEDPSHRSIHYNKYGNRTLTLVKNDPTHFDFIFQSDDPSVATITFKDIDFTLYVPIAPKWTKEDFNLEIVALVDREWNRQQVSFPPHSPHLEIVGGDGFEQKNLQSAELARNCLNAGLWEVLLFTNENGQKALYYQGWFTFPLGHYKDVFEAMNGTSYWKHWYRLEHWFDPVGRSIDLSKLRAVTAEKEVLALRQPNEKIIVAGEQLRKSRTMNAKDVRCWEDFCKTKNIQFASFIPPGRYSVNTPWNHEYERIASLEKTFVRRINCPDSVNDRYEIDMFFRSSRTGELLRYIVGGVDLRRLPQLPVKNYPKGLYMPMGIGVPPFYQSYENLKSDPPYKSPYYSLLLDDQDRWINHHEVAIDGPVMHRDESDPNLVHLYLLSYERHSLVGHFLIPLDEVSF